MAIAEMSTPPGPTPTARTHRPARFGRGDPRPLGARTSTGPHARWWQRLDRRTQDHLLADDGSTDLPVDVWGTCMAGAHAEDLIDVDGWFDDVSRRRLPFVAAAFVHVVRSAR